MQKIWKCVGIIVLMFGTYFSLTEKAFAATLSLPGNCSSVSSCLSSMSSGDTLLIADGTYGDSISSIKASATVQAANDGKVKFTGSFNPGSSGFTMQGIIVKSSNQKDLGSNNTYRRMSFVGGPSCGNVVNSTMGSNTKIYDSAFYGLGGRYLLLAYQQNGGIVLNNVIFRPDGGWGSGSGCNGWEPHAVYNMYDTEGFTISGAIVVDAISTASGESENIGGQVVNTHQSHGNVGTISQSAITMSGDYGRFSSDGMGSHSLAILDSMAKGNTFGWGMSRNCSGTTTATRFDSDKLVEAWKGSINRTTGANLVLNTTFLNDARWKQEMCTDAAVTRGFCAGSDPVGTYVATKLGIGSSTPDTTPPTSPSSLAANATSQSSITVSWTASTDNVAVTNYQVERCQGTGCSNFTQVGTPSASPFVDSGLTANTFYNYHVRAVDGAGNLSGWSNVVGATTQAPDTTPPSVPTNLQASAASSSTVNLTWTASTDNVGVTGYHVERCTGTSCTNFTQVATPTTNNYSDSTLSPSTLYRYRVRATDGVNNSNYSTIAQTTTPEAPPISQNLLLGLNFNEGTGTTSADISGHNHTGTLSNATWTTGKTGGSVSFSGNANSYVSIPNESDFDLTNNFTVSLWMKTASFGSAWASLVSKGDSSWSLSRYDTTNTLDFNSFSPSANDLQGTANVANDAWHHIAIVYDGVTKKLYVDGNIDAQSSFTQALSINNLPVRIGGNAEYTSGAFSGSVDDVRIYNTALTQSEIQTDMNTPLTQPNTPTSCNTVTTTNFSQSAYNSYGAPFDAFQTSTNLINATCSSSDPHTINATLGQTGDTTRIVYTKGYYYANSNWTQYSGTCTGAQNGDWCQGSVSATITNPNISTASASAPAYFVGMTCSVQGGGWKCGCRDTACTNFYWMVQGAGM